MLQGGINYTLLQALLFKNFLNLFLYPAFCPHIDTFRSLLEIPIILFMSIRFLDTKLHFANFCHTLRLEWIFEFWLTWRISHLAFQRGGPGHKSSFWGLVDDDNMPQTMRGKWNQFLFTSSVGGWCIGFCICFASRLVNESFLTRESSECKLAPWWDKKYKWILRPSDATNTNC